MIEINIKFLTQPLNTCSRTSSSRIGDRALKIVKVDVLEQLFDILEIYNDMRFHTKNYVSTPKNGFTDS